jgi:AhpD family alkylhydroperoxidase
MLSIIRKSTALAALALVGLTSVPAFSEDGFMAIHMDNQKAASAASTYWNIQKHFGVVPKFFQLFPEARLPAMWSEYRKVQLSADTALDAKTKQLIGLAVAAHAKCSSCIYFQTSAALANGATGKEIQEAVAISVIEDDWSKILTEATFDMVKADTNTLVSIGTLKAAAKTPASTN